MKSALTIDGNYLLHKDVFILFALKTLHSDLQKLLRLDIDRIIKLYPFDEIYFVSDSNVGYWRKTQFQNYKGDREPNDDIDWDWVYKEYESLREYIREKTRIRQIQINYAEGDDLIAHIVNNNNKLGYSNLIIATDSDLHQLLRFSISEKYINLAFNYKFSDERVYAPKNYNVFFSEMVRKSSSTLFDMTDDDELLIFFQELINKTKTVEVSAEELVFTKLIKGDKKDSVPSVYYKETKTGKQMGIGVAGAKTIYELYKETHNENIVFDSENFVDKVTEIISFVKKIDDYNIVLSIKENIRRNRELLILTEKYLPKQLLEKFNNEIIIGENRFSSPEIDNFFNIITEEKKEDYGNVNIINDTSDDGGDDGDDGDLDDFFN